MNNIYNQLNDQLNVELNVELDNQFRRQLRRQLNDLSYQLSSRPWLGRLYSQLSDHLYDQFKEDHE